MNGGELRFSILGVLLVGIGILTFSFLYFNTPAIEYTRTDLNKTLTAQVTSSAWSQFWCDVKGFFGSPCPADSIEYAIVTPLRDNDSEDNPDTSVQVDLINSPATVINEYYSNTYPVEQEVIKEVIVRDGVVDTSRFITRQEYEAQVDGIMRSIENVDTSGGGTSGLADITSESIEDLEDVASMTKVTGDLLTWTGSAWSNIATSSLGISGSGAVDSVNSQTGVVVLDTDDISEGTNQYFTATRARDTLSSSATGLSYATSTGVFSLTSGYNIPLTASTTNWNTAFGWGDHSTAGYLTTIASSTVRGMFSNTTTGLTYDSGTGATSLTAGYVIPLSASTTEWANFYNTPSTRITAGTNIDWTGNTLNVDTDLANYSNTNTAFIDLTDLSSVATGLTYNNTNGQFSLTSGYNIPLTASTTEWSNNSTQWTTTGSDIYYSTGNVGIGSSTPSSRLTVGGSTWIGGNITATGTLAILSTGTSTFAGDIEITGSIVPSANITYDLGAPTRQWRDVYIGPGSLYINGKKVIEDISDTITISTDLDQNLAMKTTGIGTILLSATSTGNLTLESNSGNININSASGNLNIGTTGSGGLNFGTIDSGVWNGTDIDISDFTNLSVSATGLSLSGDAIALTSGYTIPLTASTTEWASKLSNITGLITAGSNVSVTGSGTSGDPYSISSNGSDGVASSSVAFSVHKNGTEQTNVGTSDTLITWSTEIFDTNNNFASNRFTPTVAGKYLLTATLDYGGVPVGDYVYTRIYKNGSAVNHAVLYGDDGVLISTSVTVTVVVDANGTTDYFEVYGDTNSNAQSVTGIVGYTNFSGALIAPANGLAGGWSNDGTQSYLADYTDLVAIGTTTAAAKLDVWGSSGSSDVFRISSSTGARMLTVSADGNIGIGTTSPKACPTCSSRVLHIEGANAGLRLLDNSGTLGDFLTFVNDGGYAITDVGADTIRFRIDSTGNVGIGTTTPGATLHISSVTPRLFLDDSDATNNTEMSNYLQFNRTGTQQGYIGFDSPSHDDISIFNATGALRFYSGGFTERMRIDETGNVGIGTTTPASDAKLTISSPNTESYLMFERSNAGVFEAAIGNNGGSLVFKGGVDSFTVAGLTEFMRISSTGNVGIGTTSPVSTQGWGKLLDIANAGGSSALRLHANSTLQESGIGTDGAGLYVDVSGNTTATNNNIVFRTEETNSQFSPTERMRIDSSGKVGIGTSTPSRLLDVHSSTLQVPAAFTYSGGSTAQIGFVNSGSTGTYSVRIGSNNDDLVLQAGTAERMRISSSGKVGIGTSTPSTALDVRSINSTSAQRNIPHDVLTVTAGYNGGDGNPYDGFGGGLVFNNMSYDASYYDSAAIYGTVGDDSVATTTGGSLAFYTSATKGASLSKRMILGPSGGLEISGDTANMIGSNSNTTAGTIINGAASTGWAWFATNDAVYIQRHDNTDGNAMRFIRGSSLVGSISVTSSATAYNTTSDVRLKENIASTTTGLSTLLDLRVRDYNFINSPNKKLQGFIAQELHSVYPDAVFVGGEDPSVDPWAVDYGRLTPLIVQSIQELNFKLEDLATTTAFADLNNESFTKKFFEKLIAWFADSANGIGTMVANTFLGSEICLKDDEGTTCYTRADFDAMINGEVEETTLPPQNDAPPPSLSTDMCSNLPDIQEEVPEGYSIDSNSGECIADVSDTPEEPSLPDSPTSPVLGCTDEEAVNYAPDATEDDDSCEYPPAESVAEPVGDSTDNTEAPAEDPAPTTI